VHIHFIYEILNLKIITQRATEEAQRTLRKDNVPLAPLKGREGEGESLKTGILRIWSETKSRCEDMPDFLLK